MEIFACILKLNIKWYDYFHMLWDIDQVFETILLTFWIFIHSLYFCTWFSFNVGQNFATSVVDISPCFYINWKTYNCVQKILVVRKDELHINSIYMLEFKGFKGLSLKFCLTFLFSTKAAKAQTIKCLAQI